MTEKHDHAPTPEAHPKVGAATVKKLETSKQHEASSHESHGEEAKAGALKTSAWIVFGIATTAVFFAVKAYKGFTALAKKLEDGLKLPSGGGGGGHGGGHGDDHGGGHGGGHGGDHGGGHH
jgi:hypothetical protein